MIIAQISDTHILSPEGSDTQFSVRAEAIKAVVSDINALPSQPDVVIHTGDLAQNQARSEYEFLHQQLSSLKMPYYVTPGNRDDVTLMADIFPGISIIDDDPAFIHYYIDDYPVTLLAVDSRGLISYKGDFTKRKLDALRKSLDKIATNPAAVFMHHPPFDVIGSREPFQYESRSAVEALELLLSEYQNIIRVFCGHSHRARISTLGSIPASTTPSTAPDLRLDDYPTRLESIAVYQTHEWDGSTGFISTTRWVH
jgi:Icc protein